MIQSIRVLFLAADPFGGGSRLRLDRELREIQDAVHRGRECYALDVLPRLAPRTSDVQTLLMRDTPCVVHFSGHGGCEFGLALDESDLAAGDLQKLFAHHRDTVRVVVLNACNTLAPAEALSPLIDYVVGTDASLPDGVAITFAGAFYGALAFGKSVADAFAMATTELSVQGFPEACCYRLLTRPGADPTPLHGRVDGVARLAADPAPASAASKEHTIRMRDVKSQGSARFDNSSEGSGRNQTIEMGNLEASDLNFIN